MPEVGASLAAVYRGRDEGEVNCYQVPVKTSVGQSASELISQSASGWPRMT